MKKIKYLLLIMVATFMSVTSVKAEVPSGELYPEFATNRTVLLTLFTTSSDVSLYAYTPKINEFINGSLSLVRYEDNFNDTYSNWAIRIYQSFRSTGNYTMNWVTEWVDSTTAQEFCSSVSSPLPRDGVTNSTVCSVVGTTAYFSMNYKLNVADTGTSYVDFEMVKNGISVNWFLRLATAVYYPQIIESTYIDTETLTEQQQTMINQNQQIIQNQTQTNEKLDDLKEEINTSTQEQIESQKVCKFIDKNNIKLDNKAIDYNGNIYDSTDTGVTDYIKIINSKITVKIVGGYGFRLAFYDTNKNYLSYLLYSDFTENQELIIPTNAEYVRFTIYKPSNKPQFEICTNGNQALNDNINDLNQNITSDDISKSENEASSFFDNFSTTDNGGISSIVTAPLIAIEKMLEGTCEPLTAEYEGQTISLPCGTEIWNKMPDVQKFLNIVLGGFLCYGILSKLYLLIDRLKNPEDDRVDVMKL